MEEKDSGVISVFHMEKYIVPGAAVFLFAFLIPLALLVNVPHVPAMELVPALIACFVFGHLLESLKVYRWPAAVGRNWQTYIGDLRTSIAAAMSGQLDRQHAEPPADLVNLWDQVGEASLTQSERSDLAWNLVRWQKMITLAIVFVFCAAEWAGVFVVSILEAYDSNPFNIPTSLSLLHRTVAPFWHRVGELIIAGMFLVIARIVLTAALQRQLKSNRLRLGYIRKHHDEIAAYLHTTQPQFFARAAH